LTFEITRWKKEKTDGTSIHLSIQLQNLNLIGARYVFVYLYFMV
jgi:hypothetical protein